MSISGSGLLSSSGPVALSASGTTFDISGSTGNQTIGDFSGVLGSAATLGSKTLIFGTNTSSVTFAGVISGTTGAIQKQGSGTAVLSGINTYGGGTTLNAGILNINADAALGIYTSHSYSEFNRYGE